MYLFSKNDLNDTINKIVQGLSVNPEEWEKRANACKILRNLINSSPEQFEDFYQQLRRLEPHMDSCLSDLRSQVVREAAITVA
ncbi:CLIP-associating protein 1 [Cichlidogyrus casuarinus]|uniref:CLIP-associating protein 1 n=1 Tax=Cichlidogyrus casuarinus TaxID=1844966 RepID=A0ABD2Q6B4_9PLAT